jgi:hypothetical protein
MISRQGWLDNCSGKRLGSFGTSGWVEADTGEGKVKLVRGTHHYLGPLPSRLDVRWTRRCCKKFHKVSVILE